MKAIKFLALVAILSLAPVTAGVGDTGAVVLPSFPFGSTNALEAYAMKTINRVGIFIWATDTNGTLVGFGGASAARSYASKSELDSAIRTELNSDLSVLAKSANPRWDKSGAVGITVDCFFSNEIDLSPSVLVVPYFKTHLDKTANGYAVPTLPDTTTVFPSDMPFWIPGLKWARIEAGYVGDVDPFDILDGDWDPSTDPIDPTTGFMSIPTAYLTQPDKFWLRLYTDSGRFAKYNELGRSIALEPFTMGITNYGKSASVIVHQGDPGVTYALQSSYDFVNWQDIATNTVGPFHGGTRQFSVSSEKQLGFETFRIVVTTR